MISHRLGWQMTNKTGTVLVHLLVTEKQRQLRSRFLRLSPAKNQVGCYGPAPSSRRVLECLMEAACSYRSSIRGRGC